MADALLDAVRRERKCEPARERGPARQSELAQPRARGETSKHVEEELQDVPPADEPEHRAERPEEESVGPAGEVRLGLCLRAEAVRVTPRSAAVFELMADEPVVVEGLQVVARRRFAVARSVTREEVRPGVLDRRPRRGCPSREVQRSAEGYKACAARSNSSKSGTSAVS